MSELRLTHRETNVGHAGEFIQEALNNRDTTRAPPILMSDALSANQVIGHEFEKCLCNAHGRRGLVELIEQYPDDIIDALELYQHAWVNESHCDENALSVEQRCAYHKEHSLPYMQKIHSWCREKLDSNDVEPNSNLGKAMQYIIRHFDGLTAFCRIPGAPVGRVGMWRGFPKGSVSTPRSSNRTCAINASGFRRWSICLRAHQVGFRAWQTV